MSKIARPDIGGGQCPVEMGGSEEGHLSEQQISNDCLFI